MTDFEHAGLLNFREYDGNDFGHVVLDSYKGCYLDKLTADESPSVYIGLPEDAPDGNYNDVLCFKKELSALTPINATVVVTANVIKKNGEYNISGFNIYYKGMFVDNGKFEFKQNRIYIAYSGYEIYASINNADISPTNALTGFYLLKYKNGELFEIFNYGGRDYICINTNADKWGLTDNDGSTRLKYSADTSFVNEAGYIWVYPMN